jgi:membrane protease YdiL (CAAX protease family)
MLGILVQLAISWLIIWLVERHDLRVLGFSPTKRRISDFAFFFLIASLCCASGFILQTFFSNRQWMLNPELTGSLLSRGVILYILITRLGHTKAIAISAIAFGVYHWFSFGAFGNIPGMIFIFISTGLMGLVLAYAYSKTLSLYIACAIHFGWNFTQMFMFSQGNMGNGILIPVPNEPFRTNSLITYFGVTLFAMISVLLVTYLLLKRRKQVPLTVYDRKVDES